MKTPLSVLLKDKGGLTRTISGQSSVFECACLMTQHAVGALLIMDKEKIQGIVSERDIIRKVLCAQKDTQKITVADIMTPEVFTVPPTLTVQEGMKLITEKRFRHLPVVENSTLLGMISIGDLTRWMMLQQEKEIAALTGYIHGSPS